MPKKGSRSAETIVELFGGRIYKCEIKNTLVCKSGNLEPAFDLKYSFDIPNYLTEIGSLKAMKLPWAGEYRQSALSALKKENIRSEYGSVRIRS